MNGTNALVALALLAGLGLWAVHWYEWGRKRGMKDGYQLGRKDADDWWLGVEQQSDQARQKIWKEEGTKH